MATYWLLPSHPLWDAWMLTHAEREALHLRVGGMDSGCIGLRHGPELVWARGCMGHRLDGPEVALARGCMGQRSPVQEVHRAYRGRCLCCSGYW
jgi:hypothetical protein